MTFLFLMKMEKDLDETKIILHKSIEAVLERDEKLHDLVAKSGQSVKLAIH